MAGLFETLLQKITGTPDSTLTDQSDGIINGLMEKVIRGEEGPLTGRLAQGHPAIEKAMAGIDRRFPEARRVNVTPDKELDYLSTSSAQVPYGKSNLIQVNEPQMNLMSLRDNETVLSHEMQHIRDHRDGKTPLSEFKLPYESRPHEKRARDAEAAYKLERDYGADDDVDPFVNHSIVEWLINPKSKPYIGQ